MIFGFLQGVLNDGEGTIVTSRLDIGQMEDDVLFVIDLCQSSEGVFAFLTMFGRDAVSDGFPQIHGYAGGTMSVGKIAKAMNGLEPHFGGRIIEGLFQEGLDFDCEFLIVVGNQLE